jgi:hypothetical protein
MTSALKNWNLLPIGLPSITPGLGASQPAGYTGVILLVHYPLLARTEQGNSCIEPSKSTKK